MAKKILKRSLALGALMAFVITGSAMAAELDNTTVTNDAEIVTGTYDDLASDSVLLKRNVVGSNVVVKDADITVNNAGRLTIESIHNGYTLNGGVIQNTKIVSNGIVDLINSGADAALCGIHADSHTIVNAKEINIKSNWFGVYISSWGTNKIDLNAEKINVDAGAHALYGVSGPITVNASEELQVTSAGACAILGGGVNGSVTINAGTVIAEAEKVSAIGSINNSNVKIVAGSL